MLPSRRVKEMECARSASSRTSRKRANCENTTFAERGKECVREGKCMRERERECVCVCVSFFCSHIERTHTHTHTHTVCMYTKFSPKVCLRDSERERE